jgi:predicted AlkP superfamily phosphohydrolase/phosphomutase
MTGARTTSIGSRGRTSSVLRGIVVGCSVGFFAAALVLLLLMLRNPFFVDSVKLAVLLTVVPSGLLGGLAGLVVGAVAAVAGRGRTGRGAPLRLFLTSLVLALVVAIVGGVVSAAVQAGPADPGIKLMLIGIDGGTWDVATDMMKRGELPNLSAAVQAGTSGVLESLKPMYSTRIFTSIATGKVADKHGVVGLSETEADDVLVKRIWDIVHEQLGWDHGVVEWYLTWPPETTSGGFVVPSMLAMTTETIPPELSFVRELRDIGKIVGEESIGRFVGVALGAATNGVRLSTFAELASIALARRSSTHLEMYGRQQQALVRVVSEATRYQLRKRDVSMLAVLYKSTDSVSHKYWRFHEPSAFPGIDPATVDKFGSSIEDTYRLVDRELGELMKYLAPDGAAIIFSDHGFRASASMKASPVSYKVETLLKTFGFSLSDVSYINMGGSFYLQPLTLDEEESREMLEELHEVFSSLVVSEDGGRAFFVEMVDEPGTGDDFVLITTTRSLGEATEADPTIESPTGVSLRVSEFLSQMDISGTHAMNGIIVAVGAPFAAGGTIQGANVVDITPTALVAIGLPVADDMDGRPLVEAMTPAFLAAHPVNTVESYETEVRVQKRSEGVESMSEETKERLRALGYIQ